MTSMNEFLYRDDTCQNCGARRADQNPDYETDGWTCAECHHHNPNGSGENAPDAIPVESPFAGQEARA